MSVASTIRDYVLPTNSLLTGDSYLSTQGPMLFDVNPDASGNIKKIIGTYSYFEARPGGIYPNITVAGVQDMVKKFNNYVVIYAKEGKWSVIINKYGVATGDNLNRLICQCIATMQKEK